MSNKLSFQERLYDNNVDIIDAKTGTNHGTTSKENAGRFISASFSGNKEDKSAKGKGNTTKGPETKNKPVVQLVIDI